MKLFKQLIAWFRGLFVKEEPLQEPIVYDMAREPVQPDARVKPMMKWKKHKHPLHRYHCGTFSPLKPWARQRRGIWS